MSLSRSFWGIAIVSLLLTGFSHLAVGQDEPEIESRSQDVFLPPDHLLRQKLDDARNALRDEQYNDAVSVLGYLLSGTGLNEAAAEGEPVEDYFIEPPSAGSAQRSLKAEARRMLAELPPAGSEAYQLLYGHEANLMLEAALESGDAEALTEVIRKYFFTEAGFQATLLLGRLQLAEGRPLAAALTLKQLAEVDRAAPRFEPELSFLLASSWLLAEMPELAKNTLLALKAQRANAQLVVGGRAVALFQDDDQALAWLRDLLGKIGPLASAAEEQWLVFRGNAARNAPTKGGVPLTSVRWAVPTPNDLKLQQLVAQEQQLFLKQGSPMLPCSHPLVVRHATSDGKSRDVVVTRTPDQLLAIDFETGERIWFFPPYGVEGEEFVESTSFAAPPSSTDSPEVLKLKQRTWQDSPYGQLSSDGSNVYFVHDLGLAERTGREVFIGPGGIARNNPFRAKAFNQLVSLELAREGYHRWTVGGEDGADEPKLAGTFFLGPPLPLMEHLFVLAEVKGDIRLIVLDPATGALHWQQQLCGVDSLSITDDRTRRLSGAIPSFADGVLICPTSAGAVVAVDIARRSLLWGYQYLEPPKDARANGGFWPVQRASRDTPPGQAWADASVTIAGDKVIITPVEHDEIICLNLVEGTVDGKPLWRRERDEELYVAGIHDANVVLVGKSSILALTLAKGEVAWKTSLPDAMPSGRGFASGDHYFLPLTSSELAKVDLQGGKLVEVLKTDGILGNLVCYRDTVLSQGATDIKSFYQQQALGQIVVERLKEDPDDAWALARHGEILLTEGRRGEALDALRQSYELEADDGTKNLLIDTLLGALEDDFAANQKLAVEVDALIDRPDQRMNYLRRMALGLQDIGEARQAFEFYEKLIDEAAENSSASLRVDADDDMQQVAKGWQVRHDRWLAARLAHLLSSATEADRRAMDESVQQRQQQSLASGSIVALRRFLHYFGSHPASDRVRLALASRLWNAGELLEAELVLVDLLDATTPDIAASATAQMFRLLHDAGQVEEAAAMAQQLGAKFADIDTGDGKTGAQVLSELSWDNDSAAQWPTGAVTIADDGPALGYSSYQRVFPSDIQELRGPHAEGLRIVLDRQRRVIFRDGWGRHDVSVQLNGAETSRLYTPNYHITSTKVSGHLALLSLGYELFAIDLLRNSASSSQRLLWRQSVTETPLDSATTQHVVPKLKGNPWGGQRYEAGDQEGRPVASMTAPTHDGICVRRGEQLICFDPLRPDDVFWVRDGVPAGSALFGDRQVIFLIEKEGEPAQVFSPVDGSLLGECELPAAEGDWAKLGRRVLHWKKSELGVDVQLLDPWDIALGAPRENPVIWSHRFAADSKGTLIDLDEAAILQPDGRFVIVDIATGEIRLDQQLEPEKDLHTVYVLRGAEEYIVMANTPIDDAPDGLSVQPAPGGFGALGQSSPLVKGRIYAVARDSGNLLWPVPAVVEHFGLPLDQPAQLPLLTLMRNISPENNGGSRSWKTEVLCLDKRDGRSIFRKDDISGQTQVFHLQGDIEQKTVALMLPGQSYTLKFTTEPRPPSPPAQTGAAMP
jgi:outer membrane protein assembly factor BamB